MKYSNAIDRDICLLNYVFFYLYLDSSLAKCGCGFQRSHIDDTTIGFTSQFQQPVAKCPETKM
jgi:hypothetical protein